MLTKKLVGDLAVAFCAIALSLAYLFSTYNLRTLAIEDPLGPKAFPALLGIVMLLCGVSLAITSFLRHFNQRDTETGGEDAFANSHPVAVAAVGAWLLLYYLVFEPLGFLLATIPFLFGLMAYFNRGHWITNALVAILFPVVLELLFTHVLGMTPAPGLWSF